MAKPYYDRLAELGNTANTVLTGEPYPWDADTAADNSPVTLGQLKYVFSFELIDIDGGHKEKI